MFQSLKLPHVDQSIRHAVSLCWTTLPAGRSYADEVEMEIRPMMDRAIRDLREDASAFGVRPD